MIMYTNVGASVLSCLSWICSKLAGLRNSWVCPSCELHVYLHVCFIIWCVQSPTLLSKAHCSHQFVKFIKQNWNGNWYSGTWLSIYYERKKHCSLSRGLHWNVVEIAKRHLACSCFNIFAQIEETFGKVVLIFAAIFSILKTLSENTGR